jgi:RNA polymerase sigma factor (sigma-70 family)
MYSKAMDNYKTRLTLIQRLQNSPCDKSWEDFVSTYENYIYAIILKMGVPREESKDVMQSVLLDAWKALPKFEYRKGKSRFRSWLSVITKHAACRFYRKYSEPVEASTAVEKITEPEVEKIAEEEWKVFIAKKAFDNIKCLFSDQVLEIFLCTTKMKDYEIAEKYSISESSVRVYRMRVQKAVQKEIIRLNRDIG